MTVQDQTSPDATTSDVLQYEVGDGIATIWLNRPEVKNCINWELLIKLGEALDRAEEDDDARVVVIRGRGHTFCAGADLNMLDSEFLGTTNNSVKIAQVSAPTDQLDQALADFAAPMLDKSAFTMRITKLAANRGLDGDTETLIALESMTCNVAHQSEDANEGVQAFLEKRDPVWKHS